MKTMYTLADIDRNIEKGNLSKATTLCDYLEKDRGVMEEVLLRRASIDLAQGDVKGAIDHLNSALKINSDSIPALSNLAVLYERSSDLARAKSCFEKVYALTPHSYSSLKNLAFFLYDSGYANEARNHLRTLIQNHPFSATTHFAYSRTGVYDRKDQTLSFLQKAIPQLIKLEPTDQIKFGFTIGKANHDLGEYQTAFAAYSGANSLHGELYPHSLNQDLELLADVKRHFGNNSELPVKQWQQADNPSGPHPIFIVGMPRTGSTLVEQIVGSHSQVESVGETNFLFQSIQKNLIGEHHTFKKAASSWTPNHFKRTADDYLMQIEKSANTTNYVIDKMPGNFAFLGLIHLLFPTAKVIVTRRNAMDVIWSNYSTLFSAGLLLYTYNLESLAKYFVAQEQTVNYWSNQLSNQSIKISQHEDLVRFPKKTLRSILEYLQLPWEENCLEFHQLKSKIKTASHFQVKQPLNKAGFSRWKNYAHELESVYAFLKESGIKVD